MIQKCWDDSKRKYTNLELLPVKDSFTIELDQKSAVVAFRGSGNAGNDVGNLARASVL